MMNPGSGHVFSEIFLHLNWHCKRDLPMIRPEREPELHAFIEEYCCKVKGIHFKGIGGTETHVHLAFQMEPFVVLSDFIGKVKGASSHEMNKAWGAGALRWQRGYGVVSFSAKFLPGILQYVSKQKEHHQNGTTNPVLETYMTEGRVEEEEEDND